MPGRTPFGESAIRVAATPDAAPTPGAWPLVVISHGHGGSDLGHHDLASYLARHGFVVATFEEPGDNFHNQSGSATSRVLVGRAIEVRAVIDTVLSDARWPVVVSGLQKKSHRSRDRWLRV